MKPDLQEYLTALEEKTYDEFMAFVRTIPAAEMLNIRKAYAKYLETKTSAVTTDNHDAEAEASASDYSKTA